MTKQERLSSLESQLVKTTDFLESIELLSEIEDLKIELGLLVPPTMETDNDYECLNCGS